MPAKILAIGYNRKIEPRNSFASRKGPTMATVTEASAPAIETGRTPEFEPEGLYEFVNDNFVEKPLLGAYEVDIASLLFEMMIIHVRSNRLGRVFSEMLFRLSTSPRLDRRPDVAFVSRERWPIDRRAAKTAAWEVIPDLAIEVISPTNRTIEDARKIEDYFEAGTKAVWVIFPELAKI